MGLQQRPGITITENLIPSTETLISSVPTVAFLSAERGPSNINTVVIDQVDFINKFGFPTQYNYKAWYNIYEYLRYTNYINIMRVINTSWENYGLEFGRYVIVGDTYVRNKVELTNYYNEDIAFNTIQNYTFDSAHAQYAVINREITQTQDIAVAFCTQSDDYDLPITTENDVRIIEDVWDSVPEYLTNSMESYQSYLYTNAGLYYHYILTDLFDIDMEYVWTISSGGNTYTEITIDNEDGLWDVDGITFLFEELYFRNTKRTDLNNSYFSIEGVYDSSGKIGGTPGVKTDSTICITLTQNLNLQDTTGTLLFYDSTSSIDTTPTFTDSVYGGYIKSEKRYATYDIADNILVYADSDNEYEYVANGETYSETYPVPLCTRIIYDSKIQNSTTIKTFRNIFNKDVDFNLNFCFLVFKKYSGKFSLVEAYEVAKERDTTIGALYKKNYCEDVINQNSKYVYFVRDSSYSDLDVVTNLHSLSLNVLQANDDTTDFTDLDDYTTFETATDFYRNIDMISFKYIFGIELDDGGVVNMNLAPFIANDRKDCIAIISPWNDDNYLENYSSMTSYLISEFGIKQNSTYLSENNTYTIVYDNMKMIYSEFLEEYKWIPIIGDVAGIYTIEDIINPYSAAAGFRTQPILNVLKMLHTNVSDDNRDLMCYNSVNHVLKNYSDNNFYLFDILMYYDKDVLTKRLNIRRTLNDLKYKLRLLLKPYIFEYNSYYLRNEVTNNINIILSEMLDKGAIYGSSVICNDINNNASTIGQNELHIQILLQPAQVVRQIYIEINIEKQTLNLTEVEV